ncbi:hypothetical protein FHG08_18055 [Pseudoalteromonas sp. Scap03]|uniref:hypothetical protein n=1 Tax=unclassified Pseudoalteromonas TaxID=194690 RepID=UPI0015C1BB1E|nr:MULTISPECIES: hypothetical protein [unclassified Pseudoalteromonas]NWL17555.1 hypothetical protein [Pseudoalteromonas sp. Scap03]QLE82981.1 hypothetical protein FLM54_15680 [Pseudoalteromonas sp. Scap25]QLE90923.1 hypothetical protein FLM47_15690 [Pseudoalteromonas sp. Scap06]
MSNFKDFVKSRVGQKMISSSSAQGLATQISGTIATTGLSISSNDREKFSSEVVQVANSDEVLAELSESIGDPKKNESEDEFVERAKSTLAKILKNKLMK